VRRIIPVFATFGSAQFLQIDSGSNFLQLNNNAAYFLDELGEDYIYENGYEVTDPLGTVNSGSLVSWNATYPTGAVSGAGNIGSTAGAVTNDPGSASYAAAVSATSDLDSTLTGAGSYYAVQSISYGYSVSTLYFTPLQATQLTMTGAYTLSGPEAVAEVFLTDVSANSTTYFFEETTNGTSSVNYSQELVTGDHYEEYTVAYSQSEVQFWPDMNVANLGAGSASGNLNTTFTPAPEPITCGLLGLGATALLRRRKISA